MHKNNSKLFGRWAEENLTAIVVLAFSCCSDVSKTASGTISSQQLSCSKLAGGTRYCNVLFICVSIPLLKLLPEQVARDLVGHCTN